MQRLRRLLVALVLAAPPAAPAAADPGPVIAVAASLQYAAEDLAADFAARGGGPLRLSFGSSGNVARQIRAGAPFELFVSADEDIVIGLHRDGLTPDDGVVYAVGRLAIAVPEGSQLAADGTLADLARALEAGTLRRFAIANPEHAPYGQRAREALETAGLWQDIQPHLVMGENVAQAAQFALSGNADGGLIAWSLAISPQVAARGSSALVPAEMHAPLAHRMVLLAHAGPTARAFRDYMLTDAAAAILDRHGFARPD